MARLEAELSTERAAREGSEAHATKLAALDEVARQLPMPPAAADTPPMGASPGVNCR